MDLLVSSHADVAAQAKPINTTAAMAGARWRYKLQSIVSPREADADPAFLAAFDGRNGFGQTLLDESEACVADGQAIDIAGRVQSAMAQPQHSGNRRDEKRADGKCHQHLHEREAGFVVPYS
jgi:hypothetical protein